MWGHAGSVRGREAPHLPPRWQAAPGEPSLPPAECWQPERLVGNAATVAPHSRSESLRRRRRTSSAPVWGWHVLEAYCPLCGAPRLRLGKGHALHDLRRLFSRGWIGAGCHELSTLITALSCPDTQFTLLFRPRTLCPSSRVALTRSDPRPSCPCSPAPDPAMCAPL